MWFSKKDSELGETEHTASALEDSSSNESYKSKSSANAKTTRKRADKKVDKSMPKNKNASKSASAQKGVVKTNSVSAFSLALKKVPVKATKKLAKYKSTVSSNLGKRTKVTKKKTTPKGKTVVSLGISPTAAWRFGSRK